MLSGRKIVVVMPAYNAARTLLRTYDEVMACYRLGCIIGEVSCPTVYAPESSSIDFRGSVRYGLGCLRTAITFRLARAGLLSSPLFPDLSNGAHGR